MSDSLMALVLVVVLVAWLWREREHARERARLVERLTGVSLALPRKPVDRSWNNREEALVAKQRRGGTDRLSAALREREGG